MKNKEDSRTLALIILAASALFFVMGFLFPLLKTGYGIGPFTLKEDNIYLFSSFRYFFGQGEVFIGLLLLVFTIIFPIIKYIFLLATLLGRKLRQHHRLHTVLDLVNKWAMLDVFVVALIILNMKFDSRIIISRLQPGTTLFSISVVLLMVCSFITGKYVIPGRTSN